MEQVTVQNKTDDTQTYVFDAPVPKSQLNWLKNNRHIQSYEVQGDTLTIVTDGSDMAALTDSFIIPGLKRTFGDSLKVNGAYAGSPSR